MPDLQTLSDHHDIRELIVAYSSAIDTRDFDALDAVFTPMPRSTIARWAASQAAIRR